MDLFYRRHRNKIRMTLVFFVLAVIVFGVNRLMIHLYSSVSLQAGVSFWIAAVLLLITIASGMFLFVLEYVQVRKK